eukprot:TRINITY_DN342_c0_g1_i1.p1 TRINITY_DN342_c0_g1~~TRINITY_DN342_c0_g1_i1.p1  ORF type:complete len:260 (+),score=95.73 TRINITY_DN342_c0_g1_i1:242-1021(+)
MADTPARAPTISHEDEKRLQAQLGNAQNQQATYVLNETNEKRTYQDGAFLPTSTLYFKNCNNCEYIIDSMSTKVLIESCNNVSITINQKVVTGLVDIWKCENVSFETAVKVGTLQVDMCKGVKTVYKKKDDMVTIVWAGVESLDISLLDTGDQLSTGFSKMKEENQALNLKEDVDQFIVRHLNNKIECELIVRLSNGFPTTEREASAFDKRQEENLRKLASDAGITLGKKKGPKKPGQNEPCHCGSGKKYKKCHFNLDV